MRLDEITRDDFLQNLKDPVRAEASAFADKFLSMAGEIGWKLKELKPEGSDWVAVFHNAKALDMDDWLYQSLTKDTMKILRQIDDNGTWDARPNAQRTIEVYFG